jgi:hypothetical protein
MERAISEAVAALQDQNAWTNGVTGVFIYQIAFHQRSRPQDA